MNNFYRLFKITKSLTALCCLLFLANSLIGQVTCPTNTNLGIFDCQNIDEVPNPPNNPDDAMAAPYSLEIMGVTGSTRVTFEDSDVIFYCVDDARSVTRTITVYEDADFSFSLTPGDPIVGTCDFTIETSPDTEAPIFEAPVDIELSCGVDIDDLTQTGAVAEITDNNCPVNFIGDFAFYADAIATGDCPNVTIITRSWTAVDPCGNTSETITQKITLVDMEGPEFGPPADVTIPCGSDPTDLSLTGMVDSASITDACDNTSTITANWVDVETLENTPCAGSTTIIRRWGAVDRCGNPNTVDQMIVIDCPADCSNTDPCLGDVLTDPLPGECECQVVEAQVLGCTDPTSPNYNAAANCDDDSCGVFDLALRKELSTTGPIAPGDDVTFTITVFNQGSITAQNVLITDYMPAGLVLNDSNWADQGDGTATTTITGPILGGASESVDITLNIPAGTAPGSFENFAEITSAEDENGNPGDDIDSTADNDPDNDNLTDDEIDNGNDDEDDHDIAIIDITCVDGCTDTSACNYNPAATCDDDSCMAVPTCNDDPCAGELTTLSDDGCSCVVTEPQVLGCTDPAACNYDADANCDDNSCLDVPTCNDDPCAGDITILSDDGCSCVISEPQVLGCTDPSACNYNPDANCDDNSCRPVPTCNTDPCDGDVTELSDDTCNCVTVEPQVLGCTDSDACNYNPAANCDDDSCKPFPVCNTNPCRGDIAEEQDCECVVVEPQALGCNDPLADNYDPSANCNDGSCTYPSPCPPKMRVCTGPATPIEICLPCILSGELDAQVSEVNSGGSGKITNLTDTNTACFTYTPNPGETVASELVVEYCKPSTGQCWTILVFVDINADCGDGGVTCPDELEFCTQPTTPVEICIDCIGSLGYEYTNVVTLFHCSIDDLDDDNPNCFTYTPLPLMEMFSPDMITATYCIPGTNDCKTTEITINILEDCDVDLDACDVDGGTLAGGPFEFCIGDDVADYVSGISLSGDTGDNTAWVITDEAGNVLGLPSMPGDVNFDAAGSGTCLIWNISYNNIFNLNEGANADDFSGCYDLSNPITVNRVECDPVCDVDGGTITGGPFEFCVGDGVADMVSDIALSGNDGDNTAWVITDEAGNILGLPSMPGVVDFDEAEPGTCLIWSVSYDELVGAFVGANANDLEGCFALSNPIEVVREACAPPCEDTLNTCAAPLTQIEICIPCLVDGSYDADITDVNSLLECGLDDLEDDNTACFTYVPLPGMQNYSPDILTVEYCTASGECLTTEVVVDIVDDCGGLQQSQSINTIPHGFNEDLLQLQQTELSEKTLKELEEAPVIYPIPSGDFINVALKAEIENADLTIYNSNGQTMRTKIVDNSNDSLNVIRLDISDFNTGIYYLVAKFGDSVQATQFIKK